MPDNHKVLYQDMFSLFAGTLGLHYAQIGATAKLVGMAKMIRCTFFLRIFAESLSRGFEKQMTQLVGAANNIPVDRSHDPLHQTHESIKEVILQKGGDFVSAFKSALEIRIRKLRDAEDHLIEGAVSGDDFVFLPTKNVGAIGRRLRAFSHARSAQNKLYDYYYWAIDMVPAYASALGSTALVAVNDLGEFLGGELAILSAKIFSHFDFNLAKTAKYGIYLQQALLNVVFLYTEYLNFIADVCIDSTVWLTNNVWYPVVSGMMIALYEEAETLDPEVFPQLGEHLSQNEKSWLALLRLSHEKSVRQLGKYDSMIRTHTGDRMQSAMIENFTASKRLLEVRRQFLSLIESSKFTSEYALPILLWLRAAPLTIQTFVSRASFTAAKGLVSVARPLHLAGSVVDFIGHGIKRPIESAGHSQEKLDMEQPVN